MSRLRVNAGDVVDVFRWQDYAVLAGILGFFVSIGVYFRCTGNRQRTTSEYFLGDKTATVIPVAFSLMASFMSAVTLMGVSSETYVYGTQFSIINTSYVLATPIAAFIFIPVFFKLGKVTVYEYLALRFNSSVRLAASVCFSMQMILYMGVVLYAPALALAAVSGLNINLSILAVGMSCTVYSALGGMKAVLVTDLVQGTLMLVAVLAVVADGLIEAGGVGPIWEMAKDGGRINFFNFDPDPRVMYSFWTLVFGTMFLYLSLYAVNQAQVQRLLSTKTLIQAQVALVAQLPILIVLSLTTCFAGLVMYYRFADCDPKMAGKIASHDQLLPYYMVVALSSRPGLPGLFVSGIFSGTLSTISSGVNALSAVAVQDFLTPFMKLRKQTLTEEVAAKWSLVFTLGFGLAAILLAYAAQALGGVLSASFTIFGVVGGPLLGLFSLGMFFRVANSIGALSGLLISLICSFLVGFGGTKMPRPKLELTIDNCPNNRTFPTPTRDAFVPMADDPFANQNIFEYIGSMSTMYYTGFGCIVCITVGVVVSLLTRSCAGKEVPSSLLAPCLQGKESRRRREDKMMNLGTGDEVPFHSTELSLVTANDDLPNGKVHEGTPRNAGSHSAVDSTHAGA